MRETFPFNSLFCERVASRKLSVTVSNAISCYVSVAYRRTRKDFNVNNVKYHNLTWIQMRQRKLRYQLCLGGKNKNSHTKFWELQSKLFIYKNTYRTVACRVNLQMQNRGVHENYVGLGCEEEIFQTFKCDVVVVFHTTLPASRHLEPPPPSNSTQQFQMFS
jgi:hypothetical protein